MKPYKAQLDAVAAAVKAQRGIISMPTGVGKSLTMALLINELQVKTLLIVPNLTLKQQLTDSFKAWFGDTKNITIENIDSSSLNKTGQGYECLIIDESHHVAAETYRRLNKRVWNKIFYRYYFTATPFRSREEEQILFESVAGEIGYEIGYHEAVAEGYIVPVEAYYIEIPKTQVKGTTWPSVYSELVVNNKSRNKILHELLLKTVLNDLPTLCLVKEIKHGDILTASGGFNFVSGQDQDSKRYIELFNRQKFTALIGTTGVLGEGVDTRPAECIIIAGLGKSRPQFMQCVGRGIRRYGTKTSCKVIILLDKSHRWSIAHYKEQCKILKEEYGVVPVRIET